MRPLRDNDDREVPPGAAPRRDLRRAGPRPADAAQSGLDQLGDFLTSREGKRVQKEVMRGVFGMLRKRL